VAGLAVGLTAPGCAAGTAADSPFVVAPLSDSVPSGFGSLRQDEVSVTLVEGDVQLRITPLAPSVLRLTAPDTERRLGAALERAGGLRPGSILLFVQAYTEAPAAPFEPKDLRIEVRGRLLPFSAQTPIDAEWGSGQLRQRRPSSAVYRFDGEVRWLEEPVRFTYRSAASDAWSSLLPTLDLELARVRARARGGRQIVR
jgi:hypothetical protein